MKDPKEIQKDLDAAGLNQPLKKNYKFLYENLQPDEVVKAFFENVSFFVITDRRVISTEANLFGNHTSKSFTFDRINSVSIHARTLSTELVVSSLNGETIDITANVNTLNQLKSFIENAIEESKEKSKKSVASAPVDIPAQIEKLAALKDKGILTEEEFSNQKMKLLEKM